MGDEMEIVNFDEEIDAEEALKLMTPSTFVKVKVEQSENHAPILEVQKEEEFKLDQSTRNWVVGSEALAESVIADRAKFLMEPPERTTFK